MSRTHEVLFGELRSLASSPPGSRNWRTLAELVVESHEHSPERHAEVVEPYLLGALSHWPVEVRRAWLFRDIPQVIALAKTLVLECRSDGPTPDDVERRLSGVFDDVRRVRITRLDVLKCIHGPLSVLQKFTECLPSVTGVYFHAYYEEDLRRAKRRERLSVLDATHVVGEVLDAWAPQLERLGFSSIGIDPPGETANDLAWGRVLRELDRLPNLRALEVDLCEDDTTRWDQELLRDPRLAKLEELTINGSVLLDFPQGFVEEMTPGALRRVKITNCPEAVATALVESERMSSVRQWELLLDFFVRAPVEWGSRPGMYWAARAPSCPETFDDLFASKWLNLLDFNSNQTKTMLFDGRRARSSERVEGVSLRQIAPRDLKRALRVLPKAVPNVTALHIHEDLIVAPADVRAMHDHGLVDQLESLSWCYRTATQRDMRYGVGGFGDECRAEWYELVADEGLHPALRQRAWRSLRVGIKYKDSHIALAKQMGLTGLSRKTIPELAALIDANAPSIVDEPLLLNAATPAELLEMLAG